MSKDRDAAGVFRAPSAQLLMCMVLHSDAVAIAEYPSGCSVRRSVGRAACIPSELNRLFTQTRQYLHSLHTIQANLIIYNKY